MPHPVYRAILLFGLPGVGKGTQGQRIGSLPHFRHVSTGELFRSLDPESSLGQEVRSYSERGLLVPDELTIRIFHDAIGRLITSGQFDPAQDTLALDGIPRNVNQAKILDGQLRVLRIIYLVSSDEQVMIDRMKRRAEVEGRKDDADEDVIRRRFDVYRRETKPVLECYPRALIAEIDALGTPDEVTAAIKKELAAS
ncbi:MAG TPA: nucleoside monophosphate kinase [Planctomycetaceae bacterium]|jgi:adenylate kinase|nr:nucleoside monophosphate kinase [Planctomycetaceae bacterium]